MTETMHDRLRKRLKAVNMVPNEASLAAGLSRGYLQSVFNREKTGGGANIRELAKLAPVLKTTVTYLINGEGPETASTPASEAIPAPVSPQPPVPHAPSRYLPVYGLAAGSVTGMLTMTNDAIEEVPSPEVLARVRDAYAVIVTGSSMEPRYTAGDYVFVHPHKPIRQGDHVIIQEARDGGTVVSIKRFERLTDTHLVTVQYNPPEEVKFPRDQITAMHRVLTSNEVAGV
ncbi:XRE family transcriptional regulator [Oricola indica]|jgi:phage repressor protein C with HTH and peptisase S24 domain|uniref:XRE family transcriptional regulator n=1 Tax=Oricola indica TaxID=2872591 RepID=UPI001CBDA731|nr:S24 family peptidase [Oricola indica]